MWCSAACSRPEMSCESARACLRLCVYGTACVCVVTHGRSVRVCMRVPVCVEWMLGVGLVRVLVQCNGGSDRAVCLLCVLVLPVAVAMAVLVLLGALAARGVRRSMASGCAHQSVGMSGCGVVRRARVTR